jgi:imidazole glycerol phosphate synthase glutamine amidotransferase subunit
MITVLDYGAGNLKSVTNMLHFLGANHNVTSKVQEVEHARAIIFPGVGHFGQMVQALDDLDLRAPLIQKIKAKTPLLGICLGMQAFFEASEEAPGCRGLGILAGTVRKLEGSVRVPHIGWDTISVPSDQSEQDNNSKPLLLKSIDPSSHFYFANSYAGPAVQATAAICDYGTIEARPWTAIIEQGTLFGTQFHPEKSGDVGAQLLKNFLEVVHAR